MKRVINSILIVLLFTSFNLVPAYAQLPNLSLYQTAEKTQYKLKLEAGKQYYLKMINELQISDPTPAKEQSMVITIGTGAQLDVSNIDANGNAQVAYTYKWVKYGTKFPGKEAVYDSSKKDSTVPEEFQWFAPLLEESFTLTISPEGRISEIKDLEKVRSNVQQKLPQGASNEIAIRSLDQWLNEQAMRETIEGSLAIYPDRPVGVGDSWSRNVAYSGGFPRILESKWTLKERKNGVAVIEAVSAIKPNPQAKPTEMGQGITSSSEFTGNEQGLIEIQESTGLIIKSNINQQMSGQNTITRPGAPDTVTPMELKIVVATETSDWEQARLTISTNAVAQERPRREAPFTRQDSFQRRANLSAASGTTPYLTDDEEESSPARSRPRQQKSDEALYSVVAKGDIAEVQSLLSKGADVNLADRMRWTPLHIAVRNGRQDIVELLVNKGANLNLTNNRGQTPLHIAVNSGHKEIVELLITKGADVNIMAGSENALTLARKAGNAEIIDLLTKNGAREPSPQDLMGDRYYPGGANPYGAYQEQTSAPSRGTRGYGTVGQPVEVDILADPNEIKARIKTFAGLQKALDDVAAKSQNEMRQWQQTRYDNRTMLLTSVQKQFEDEIKLIRTVSVGEKAKKTTEAIDGALSLRQERFKVISKELMAQRREQRQAEQMSGRTRGRGRTSGRSTRGYGSQGDQYDSGYDSYGSYGRGAVDPYGRGGVTSRMGRYPGTTVTPSQQTAQPVDMEAENEKRQWTQASFDNKSDLASAVNEQIRLEVTSIRDIAVEEAAKKTTAAIDGVLLAREMRLDAYLLKMEEQQLSLRQQTQDPRMGMRGGYQQDSRYIRGGTTGGYQQGSQPRTRRRR